MDTDFLTTAYIDARARLHRFATRMLRDDEDAADALQDAYLRLRCRGDISSDSEARFRLAAVLRNLCVDRLRKRRETRLEMERFDDGGYEMPDTDAAEMSRLLRSGLTSLQKRIISLVADEGMEYSEIARQLGMTVEAVRMNASRARARIRENYKKLNR